MVFHKFSKRAGSLSLGIVLFLTALHTAAEPSVFTPRNKLLHYLKNQPRTEDIQPFVTDLCTWSPQSYLPYSKKEGWTHCCIEHDIAHWAGGTKEERKSADLRLRQCIKHVGGPYRLFYRVVRRLGHPNMVFDAPITSTRTFPWGYGWDYFAGHDPLSEQQKASRCAALEEWSQTEQFETFEQTYEECQGRSPYLLGCPNL